MKSFDKISTEFVSPDLDADLERWLNGRMSEAERKEWLTALSRRSRFREDFCDWVKSLRDPGWAIDDKSRRAS